MTDRYVGNYVEYTIASASTVTININLSGTDTNATKYVGLARNANAFVLVPSDGIRINKVNQITFKTARPVSTAGITWKDNVPDEGFNSMEIEVLIAGTTISLQVL